MDNRAPITRYIPVTGPQKYIIVPGSCLQCYKIPTGEESLKSCSGCRLVSYCSKICQKQNWTAHKKFCNVAKAQSEPGKNIFSSAKERIENGENWIKIVLETFQLMNYMLGPKFGYIERQILSVPRVCELCRSSDISTLKLCKDCRSVYYCSEAHLETDSTEHKNVCSTFRFMVQCDEFMATKGYPDMSCMPFPSKPATRYEKLPKSIEDLIRTPSDPIDAIISDWLSYPLSIIYALEKTGLGMDSSPVHKAKKLTIHMMHCVKSLLKLHMCVTWEYLFHRLPNLKRLRVVMIDSELMEECGLSDSDHFQRTETLCDDCKQRGRKLTINMERNLRMYKRSDRYERPDVILAHGVNDPTTGGFCIHVAEPSIPLVMLSIIRESIEEDLESLSSMMEDHTFELPIQVNPFRGQRPMRACSYMNHIYAELNNSFMYGNGYICAVKRRIKDGMVRHRITPNK